MGKPLTNHRSSRRNYGYLALFLFLFEILAMPHEGKADCNPDLLQYAKHWDGECPVGAKWDKDIDCCVLCQNCTTGETHSLFTSTHDSTVRDVCSENDGHLPPNSDGTCPADTSPDSQNQCCIPCRKCPRGSRRTGGCLSPCQPCPPGTYNDGGESENECFPCQRCDVLHRVFRSNCTPDKNAKCGNCTFGYFELQHVSECSICSVGHNHTECGRFLDQMTHILNKGGPQDTNLDVKLPLYGFLLLVSFGAIVLILLVVGSLWFCRCHKRGKEVDTEAPDQTYFLPIPSLEYLRENDTGNDLPPLPLRVKTTDTSSSDTDYDDVESVKSDYKIRKTNREQEDKFVNKEGATENENVLEEKSQTKKQFLPVKTNETQSSPEDSTEKDAETAEKKVGRSYEKLDMEKMKAENQATYTRLVGSEQENDTYL